MPASRNRKPIIVIGGSARLLALSARRGGWDPITIDYFGDTDTQNLAYKSIVIPSEIFHADDTQILSMINDLGLTKTTPLVYGSGIDTRPGLLKKLSNLARVFGNTLATLQTVNTPYKFFSALEALSIPFPETRFDPPDNKNGWLSKLANSQGGMGVMLVTRVESVSQETIYQKFIPGKVYSVLFLADGRHSSILGFNIQWTHKYGPNDFLFSGVMSHCDLSEKIKKQIVDFINKLVEFLPLRGLNCIDFVIERGLCLVLEVNPRPSASMALYDQDFRYGLLTEHINAVNGKLPHSPIRDRNKIQAIEIIFASEQIVVQEGLIWPEWAADTPPAATTIPKNSPVCSISASANNPEAVKLLLKHRKNELMNQLSEQIG